MNDQIVYLLVTLPGGVDGRSPDKGGRIMGAYFSREEALHNPHAPWCAVRPEVHDLDDLRAKALAKLDALDKLAILKL